MSLPKHFSNISKICAPLNPFLTQNLMQSRWHFFLWKIETTHKDRCTQYSVTSTNVKLSSWKSDRTSMTLLPRQQQKKNWNRPNESAIRWRVLKFFDQGGIDIIFNEAVLKTSDSLILILRHPEQENEITLPLPTVCLDNRRIGSNRQTSMTFEKLEN